MNGQPKNKTLTPAEIKEYNEQMARFRKTGIAYLSEEDMDMDFSKVDDPNNINKDDNEQDSSKENE